MPKLPTISEAEWEVMRILWSSSPQSAAQVIEALAPEKNWGAATIKTMLNRLVKKGALGHRSEGKRYLYFPRVTQDQCMHEETRSFLDRVFGGAVGPMLNYFVDHEKLSPQEIAELRKILERKGK
jgi:BlaI family penicillinase repressor